MALLDIRTGKEMTRGGFLKGILAAGIAPSIVGLAGSANGGVGRGMMRGVGARMATAFGGENLPYDAEVEYLESHGTEYIDIERPSNEFMRIELEILKADINGVRRFILGTDRSSILSIGSSTYFDVNTSGFFGQNDNMFQCIVDRWYSVVCDKSLGYSVDGGKTFSKPSNIYVLRSEKNQCILSLGMSKTSRFIGRIGRINCIASPGFDDIDLIPVSKDGVGYMYDSVSNKLLGNKGEGTFEVGPIKN